MDTVFTPPTALSESQCPVILEIHVLLGDGTVELLGPKNCPRKLAPHLSHLCECVS